MKDLNQKAKFIPDIMTLMALHKFYEERMDKTTDNTEKEVFEFEMKNVESMIFTSSAIGMEALIELYEDVVPKAKRNIEYEDAEVETTETTTREEVNTIVENATTNNGDEKPGPVVGKGKVIQMNPNTETETKAEPDQLPNGNSVETTEEEVPVTSKEESTTIEWHDFKDNVKEIYRNAGEAEAKSYVDDAFAGKLGLLDKHKKPIDPEKWSAEKVQRWWRDVLTALKNAEKAAKLVEEKTAEKGKSVEEQVKENYDTKVNASGQGATEFTPETKKNDTATKTETATEKESVKEEGNPEASGGTEQKKESNDPLPAGKGEEKPAPTPVASAKPVETTEVKVDHGKAVNDLVATMAIELGKFIKMNKPQEETKAKVQEVRALLEGGFTQESVLNFLTKLIDENEADLSLLKYKEGFGIENVYGALAKDTIQGGPIPTEAPTDAEVVNEEKKDEGPGMAEIQKMGNDFIDEAKTRDEARNAVQEVANEYILNKDIPGMNVKFTNERELAGIVKSLWEKRIMDKFPLSLDKDLDKAKAKEYVVKHAKKPGKAYYIAALKKYLVSVGFVNTTLKEAQGVFEGLNKEWKLNIEPPKPKEEPKKSASLLGTKPAESATVEATGEEFTEEVKEEASSTESTTTEDETVNVVGWETIELTAELKPLYEGIRESKSKRTLKDKVAEALKKVSDRSMAYRMTIRAIKEGKAPYVKSVGRMQVNQLVSMIQNIERKAS